MNKMNHCAVKSREHVGVFFLTGLIWARTVFCIDMGNIVYRNMVKIHLPHMYMIFVECYRKQLCSSDLQYCTKLFNTFRIRSALSSLSLQTLWVRCNFFRNTFFFFWLWSRSISSLSLPYSNLVCNFLTFVPRPVMVVKLDQKYLEPSKRALWYLLRFQIHCQCIRRLYARILVQPTNALTMDL